MSFKQINVLNKKNKKWGQGGPREATQPSTGARRRGAVGPPNLQVYIHTPLLFLCSVRYFLALFTTILCFCNMTEGTALNEMENMDRNEEGIDEESEEKEMDRVKEKYEAGKEEA